VATILETNLLSSLDYIDATEVVIGSLFTIIFFYLAYKRSEIEPPDIKEPLKELSDAKSIQEIAASQINILGSYYNNVLSQSQRSFYFALAAAGIGLLFIMVAAGFLLVYNLQSLAIVTTLGGALSAFVSGVNFHIYNKSSSQLANFHQRLDMTQRFLLSDGICNTIKDSTRQDETRADLIKTIAGPDLKK
jgi:hypothetical protein